ncbi:MAG TPA: class I SAM-dependent methyltransferase, partial [Candidatus Baltobacteraceae bacterium]|nr:class I SAM-dependent methyltransferase [Candidatus Baltobacteraceae bacterium]
RFAAIRRRSILPSPPAGVRTVAFATNARSFEVLQGVLGGHARFPAGRALGRAEFGAEVRAAGYEIAAADRVFTRKITVPSTVATGFSITVGSFSFSQITPEALFDFLSDAFLFTPFAEDLEEPPGPGEPYMSETVTMTIPIVTVSDIALPRWMTSFAKHFFAIPTHMTVQERLALFQTAIALPPGFAILEIGSYLGASTAFLGFAALHRAGFVHAIDPWTNDAMGAEGGRDTLAEFRRNTEPFAHYIVPHQGFSADVHARESRIPCDMIFIDGDHNYDAVVTDLRLWLPSLRPGGILAMHDIDAPDVKRAFDTVVGADRLTAPAQVIDRLLIAQPINQAAS